MKCDLNGSLAQFGYTYCGFNIIILLRSSALSEC